MNGSSAEAYGQFIIVLLIFVGVLAVTYFVTKWMAGYQKKRNSGTNIELVDSAPLSTNKYIQIVRTGKKYLVLAVCKDTVTMLTELEEEELELSQVESGGFSFKDILSKADNRINNNENE